MFSIEELSQFTKKVKYQQKKPAYDTFNKLLLYNIHF